MLNHRYSFKLQEPCSTGTSFITNQMVTLWCPEISCDEWCRQTDWTKIPVVFMSIGWDNVSELRPPTDLLFITQMSMESYGGMTVTDENRITRRKTCPSATLSTTHPTCIDPGANAGLRGDSPGTNRWAMAWPTLHRYGELQGVRIVGTACFDIK
jgi:hypothetical protein